jgi:hypothetical protein
VQDFLDEEGIGIQFPGEVIRDSNQGRVHIACYSRFCAWRRLEKEEDRGLSIGGEGGGGRTVRTDAPLRWAEALQQGHLYCPVGTPSHPSAHPLPVLSRCWFIILPQ